jgi:outer membrane immunogenic protein
MKNVFAPAILPALILMTQVASGQNAAAWEGFYLGASLGNESGKVCNGSTLTGVSIDPAAATFTNCSGSGLLGGLQFGENVQFKKLVVGIAADIVISRAKSDDSTLHFSGTAPPPGTYSFSGRLGPKDFAILGGRIGYGGSLLFPYVRAGAVVAGSQSMTLEYIPTGAAAPIASFTGGKNFNTTGWAAGAGMEIGLNGAWSISAEYLHMNLGKGSSSTTTCAGAASACAAFADISLDNTHNAFTANIFRIGVNYWFNYWDKP